MTYNKKTGIIRRQDAAYCYAYKRQDKKQMKRENVDSVYYLADNKFIDGHVYSRYTNCNEKSGKMILVSVIK